MAIRRACARSVGGALRALGVGSRGERCDARAGGQTVRARGKRGAQAHNSRHAAAARAAAEGVRVWRGGAPGGHVLSARRACGAAAQSARRDEFGQARPRACGVGCVRAQPCRVRTEGALRGESRGASGWAGVPSCAETTMRGQWHVDVNERV
eukprot:5861129-Prymnesium_polylepis.1